MSESTNVQKAEYLLKMMLFDPSRTSQLGVYHWASESDRWNELVAILMSHVFDLPEEELRRFTKYLSDLGHLNIDRLAKIKMNDDEIDRFDEEAAMILGIFRRIEVPEQQAMRVLLPLCQISRKLNSNFGGKIQLYLRSYGESMLKDVPNLFSLKSLRDDEMQWIFTRWIQAVLNMPVLLQDPVVYEFCQKNGITVTELLEAADKINMNVAIIDELLQLESASERKND